MEEIQAAVIRAATEDLNNDQDSIKEIVEGLTEQLTDAEMRLDKIFCLGRIMRRDYCYLDKDLAGKDDQEEGAERDFSHQMVDKVLRRGQKYCQDVLRNGFWKIHKSLIQS